MKLRLPHPFVLLLGAVAVAALLTWIIPAGEYQRRKDEATGREVVIAGTYTRVAAAPGGLKGCSGTPPGDTGALLVALIGAIGVLMAA